MSELTLKGRLIQVLPTINGVSKGGKEWSKREFVIETDEGQFSKKVAFTLFGDKLSLIDPVGIGATVEVSFNLESRDFDGKWYHNINAWKITANEAPQQHYQPAPEQPAPATGAEPENNLPF